MVWSEWWCGGYTVSRALATPVEKETCQSAGTMSVGLDALLEPLSMSVAHRDLPRLSGFEFPMAKCAVS